MVFTGNTDVAAALARWAAEKDARTFYDVLRRCSRGELLYDVTGSHLTVEDGAIAAGSTLGLRTHAMDDGSQYLLVFTSDAEIARTHPEATRASSLVQPALEAVRFGASESFAGVILDAGAGAASCIVTADEIRRGLPTEPGVAVELKDALAGPSLPGRRSQTLDVLARTAVVYIPVQHLAPGGSPARPGEPSSPSVPTASGPGGRTLSAAFTSPAEVWAWLPGAEAYPTSVRQVVRSTLDQDGHAGLIVNPGGPPLIVTRPELEMLAGSLG
ncbi:SseB family protein [Labedella phragmitis]|uniref:SseB family protein n=1 Tax=Labedella phragmitis TaxID=2498849 RepID=A0A3S5CFD1_9MICO|nr:SseB family protein [Labedella phragmitis]RWZ52730.1 SseB family protein [Labedella phragmitis]